MVVLGSGVAVDSGGPKDPGTVGAEMALVFELGGAVVTSWGQPPFRHSNLIRPQDRIAGWEPSWWTGMPGFSWSRSDCESELRDVLFISFPSEHLATFGDGTCSTLPIPG
jgi:hypothetical protein